VFTEPERLALAGFLAGYTGLTREAYALDLRQYASWCQQQHLRLFQARRADIECFARDLEARGRARATITRRLCTIAGFYSYADLWIMPTFARSACSMAVSGSGLSA
jgi:integrase/recombinase XerD